MTEEQQNRIIDNVISEMHHGDDARMLRDRLQQAGFQIIYVKSAEMTGELVQAITERST
jgi:hypothetical protein